MNREERQRANCQECGAEPPDWYEKDPEQDWGWAGVGPRFHCLKCDAYLVIVAFEVKDYQPQLDDELGWWLEESAGAGLTAEQLLEQWRLMIERGHTVGSWRKAPFS